MTTDQPLAIVGLGCLFPRADGPGAYWANIKNRVDGIGPVPPTHWDPADYFDADPKHRMALVFRWYLGLSSRWANGGDPGRQLDYQVWCGPAMGAFNEWAKGSFLEQPRNRRVVTVALNLLYGAAVLLRLNMLRCQGVPLSADQLRVPPLELEQIQSVVRG